MTCIINLLYISLISVSFSFFSASVDVRYTPRILGRRFPLTLTSYKWIDVGITVGPVSCFVDLLLGDNKGNRIVLPYRTWRALIERRVDVERFVENERFGQTTEASSSLAIHELNVKIVKLGAKRIVKLKLGEDCIFLKPATMQFIFELEYCVEQVYYTLYQSVTTVTEKFKYFVNFLRQNCVTNKRDAKHMLCTSYDKNSQIECELITYAIDLIVGDALHGE